MQMLSRPTGSSNAAFLAAIYVAACSMLPTTESLAPIVPLASTPASATSTTLWIQSENSKHNGRGRGGRQGGYPQGGGGGQEYDYSGGNLKYGTGKYTQRENDGYQGGVNISKNGRSMQDGVYREDRLNVDRARGRPRGGNDFDSRMDEIEDLERGLGRGIPMGGPREGMRDRMMRNRRNGPLDGDMYDMGDDYGPSGGVRNRMGGGGLLRDLQEAGGRNRDGYDDFGSRGGGYSMGGSGGGKVMGGSSHGRGGGYRSSQFQSDLSNERRRFEEYGFRMEDYLDEQDLIDETGRKVRMNNGRRRNGYGMSNFDRRRDNADDFYDDEFYGMDRQQGENRGMGGGVDSLRQQGGSRGGMSDSYRQGSRGMGSNGMDSFRERHNGRGGSRRGGRGGRQGSYNDYDGYGDDYGDYGDDYRGGSGGGLLRDRR